MSRADSAFLELLHRSDEAGDITSWEHVSPKHYKLATWATLGNFPDLMSAYHFFARPLQKPEEGHEDLSVPVRPARPGDVLLVYTKDTAEAAAWVFVKDDPHVKESIHQSMGGSELGAKFFFDPNNPGCGVVMYQHIVSSFKPCRPWER